MGGLAACVWIAIACLTAAACGITKSPAALPTTAPLTTNELANPGLEQGDAPWIAKIQPEWTPFSVSDSVALRGSHALELNLRGGDADRGTHIAGALQTITPKEFPDFVSGFYRVEHWDPHAQFQYLQFVVAVHGGDWDDGVDIHEARFVIAGANRDPLTLSNARFIFLNRDAPVIGRWTYFGYPVKQAFATRLAHVPTTWTSIDVFFEARYDGRSADQAATSADVYYDDLYLGPQTGNPNRP